MKQGPVKKLEKGEQNSEGKSLKEAEVDPCAHGDLGENSS